MHRVLPALLPMLACASICAQSWTPGPVVPTAGNAPRALGNALNSSSGMFLFGGTPLDGNGDAPVQMFNGTTWSTAPNALEGAFFNGGAAEDELGRMLVIAGRNSTGSRGDSYWWTVPDGNNGGIQQRSNAPRHGFGLATDDQGFLYSLGGSTNAALNVADPAGAVQRLDATSDTWTVLAAMPTPVGDVAACNDGQGHLLVFGGYDASGQRTANVAQFDLTTGTWSDTAVPDMPLARAGCRAALGDDGLIYVVGGSDAAGPLATTIVLEPATGTWITGPTMAVAREHFGLMLDDSGNLWAIGGTTTNTTEFMFTPTCPAIVTQSSSSGAFLGGAAGLEVLVAGSGPFTFQWRKGGTPLQDGQTPHGSTIIGATTSQLGITGLTNADAGSYDCVISNSCGTTTSAPATISVVAPPAFPNAFVASSLHPASALSSVAKSVDGGTIVGDASYPHPQYNQLSHPTMWPQLGAGAPVDLTPVASVGGSARRIRNDVIVGWWWWPYTNRFGTGYYQHASIWTGGGMTHHEAQTSGWEIGSLSDTDGTTHVGTMRRDETATVSHGYVWQSIGRTGRQVTPVGAWGSSCGAVDGEHTFGNVNLGFGTTRAAKWTGTSRDYVTMTPAGYTRGFVFGASDGQQVGSVYIGNIQVPGMWSGTAASFQPLVPAGATSASLRNCRYGLQVGAVQIPGGLRAAIWRSSADDWLDLHQFAPANFARTTAEDVWIDPVTNEMVIVGSGFNNVTQRTEALLWRGAAVAAGAETIGEAFPVTLEFTPDGIGGYNVARVSPIWFDDLAANSTEIASGGLLAENAMSGALSLGFSFAMPGGTTTTQVFVDDNCRVVSDPTATSQRYASAGTMRLGPAVIAPFWTDLSSALGSVRFFSDPAQQFATITWRDVPQEGESNGFTLQLRLRADGSFACTYLETRGWQNDSNNSSDAVLIGCSPGGGGSTPNPASVNFADYPIATGGVPVVQQVWAASAGARGPSVQPHLTLMNHATAGGTLEIDMDPVTSAVFVVQMLIGWTNPALDLTGTLTGITGVRACGLYADPVAAQSLPVSGNTARFALPIPNIPAMAGIQLYVQGAMAASGESLLGIVLSDAMRVTVGQ